MGNLPSNNSNFLCSSFARHFTLLLYCYQIELCQHFTTYSGRGRLPTATNQYGQYGYIRCELNMIVKVRWLSPPAFENDNDQIIGYLLISEINKKYPAICGINYVRFSLGISRLSTLAWLSVADVNHYILANTVVFDSFR